MYVTVTNCTYVTYIHTLSQLTQDISSERYAVHNVRLLW